MRRSRELSPQDLSTTAWAFATLHIEDEPLLESIAASAVLCCRQFNAQHLSNTAWAFAILGYADETLLAAISAQSLPLIGELDVQNISNTVWSFAALAMGAAPFLAAMSAAAHRRLAEFGPQELSNTAWSLARLAVVDEPLMYAISSAALSRMLELSVQDLTNIPWAFASMQVRDEPLMNALSAGARSNIAAFGQPTSAAMALWTLWRSSHSDLAAELFDIWSSMDVFQEAEPFGLLLMDNDWWKDAGWELDILDRLHRVLPVRSVYLSMSKLGHFATMPSQACHPSLRKVANLVDAVVAAVSAGSGGDAAAAVLAECEHFAQFKGQWLKVAGREKGDLLQRAWSARPLAASEWALEFGAFVGYTAVRLGRKLQNGRDGWSGCGIVSLEVSPVHVCIARHLIDIAELSDVNEVKAGQAKDVLPRVCEEAGVRCCAFGFMDHRGTIFHQDFSLVEGHSVFAVEPHFVTDNTLNPGAPVFLWQRVAGADSGGWITTPFALTEFLSFHEDWTALTAQRGRPRSGRGAV
mmetsp:Transcript_89963/g.290678  ORF Transcript_89963/g.290678 Transcript_89963/m.290678 type:complete len:525 (+) Transcript_89963:1041-2615(+)